MAHQQENLDASQIAVSPVLKGACVQGQTAAQTS